MSDYYSSQSSTGVYGTLAKLMPGDRLIVDRPQTLAGPVKMSVPMTELLILATLTGGTDVAIELAATYIKVRGRVTGTVSGSFRSAIMATSAALSCVIEDLIIQNYNTSNSNGHAAIFGYKCSDLTVQNCRTSNGNGNGIRLDGVTGALVIGNSVSKTGGSSSEGITLGAKHIRCERNIVDRANVAGILIFVGPPYEDIAVVENTVSNSSQTSVGTHPGIGIVLNGSTITGLRVQDNCCYDDQTTPTQSHAIAIYGPGKIAHGRVSGNMGWGNQASDPLTLVAAPDLTTDCQVSVTGQQP